MKNLKQTIINNIKIIDLAEENNLTLEECYGSIFTHKCRCPSLNHKNGRENTPSFFINNENNSYFCFGCNIHGNVLDFYMLLKSCTFSESLHSLKDRLSSHIIYDQDIPIKKNNFISFIRISNEFRKSIKQKNKSLKDINYIMKQYEKFIESNIMNFDELDADKVFNQIKRELDKV